MLSTGSNLVNTLTLNFESIDLVGSNPRVSNALWKNDLDLNATLEEAKTIRDSRNSA